MKCADEPNGRCPTCNSRYPERHPAMQFEGEVELCVDDFHLIPTNANKPEYIAAVQAKRAAPLDATLGKFLHL